MTTTCPNGHESQDPQWCDTCGARLGAAPATPDQPAVPTSSAAPGQGATSTATSTATPAGTSSAVACTHCGTPNLADALFCEACGYDFTTGQAPPSTEEAPAVADGAQMTPTGWVVVVEVDSTWYQLKGQLADRPCPEPTSSTITLVGATALIGRSSQSRQLSPEITLDGDTGVSRRHAQLLFGADGTWTVVDLGSSNGTYVVAADAAPTPDLEAVAVGIPHPVGDRDAIFVGAWTKLTLRNASAPASPPQ